MHVLLFEEREGDLGSSKSSSFAQSPCLCLWLEMETVRESNQNRGSSTAQNRHLMVKVCTDVAGGGVRVLPLQDVFNPKQIWRQALRTAMKCG